MRVSVRLNGKDRGAILVTVLVVMLFLAVLGMSMVSLLVSWMQKTDMKLDRLRAFYLAESGVAASLWELKLDKDVDGGGIGTVSPRRLGGGSFFAYYDFQSSLITAVGEFNKVRRMVQVKFRSL